MLNNKIRVNIANVLLANLISAELTAKYLVTDQKGCEVIGREELTDVIISVLEFTTSQPERGPSGPSGGGKDSSTQ